MLAWQLWIAAWMQPRLAMWTTCARSSAQNMSRLVSNPLPSQACATGPNAIRPCAGSLTVFLLIIHMSCSSAHVRTQPVQSVEGRPLCPAARMKRWINPTALHRWGSAKLTMCAGRNRSKYVIIDLITDSTWQMYASKHKGLLASVNYLYNINMLLVSPYKYNFSTVFSVFGK